MSGIATAIVVGGVGGAAIGGVGSYLAADKQADAIKDASAISAAAATGAREDITSLYGTARGDYLAGTNQSLELLQGPNAGAQQFQPYADAGLNALQQQIASTQGDPYAGFEESEAQRFYRERQEQSLLRNSAAIGGLGGGNVRTALQEQAVGIAGQQRGQYGQEQQQIFQNLGSLSNLGFQAGTNIANLSQQDRINLANLYERQGQGLSGLSTGQGTTLANIATGQGTQQANLAQSQGAAEAAGLLGVSNAASTALQSVAGGAGYYYGQQGAQPNNPYGTYNPAIHGTGGGAVGNQAIQLPASTAANNPYSYYGGAGSGQPTILT